MEEKVKELVADQGFVDKLLSCEEPEQVQALFAENGVELTLDDVKSIGQGLEKTLSSGEELSEDDLEAVAGGVAAVVVVGIIGAIASIFSGTMTLAANFDRVKDFFRRW